MFLIRSSHLVSFRLMGTAASTVRKARSKTPSSAPKRQARKAPSPAQFMVLPGGPLVLAERRHIAVLQNTHDHNTGASVMAANIIALGAPWRNHRPAPMLHLPRGLFAARPHPILATVARVSMGAAIGGLFGATTLYPLFWLALGAFMGAALGKLLPE
jgi:hypothetical protein